MNKAFQLLIEHRSKIKIFLFMSYCLFIIYYTILSREVYTTHRIELRFMWAYKEMLINNPKWKDYVWQNISNIIFFVPFGAFFPTISSHHFYFTFKNRKWLTVLVLGGMFSAFIEITQYLTYRGLCELDDVVCNSAGALIGYGIYHFVRNVLTNMQKNNT